MLSNGIAADAGHNLTPAVAASAEKREPGSGKSGVLISFHRCELGRSR